MTIPQIPANTKDEQLIGAINDRIRRINEALGAETSAASASATLNYGTHAMRVNRPVKGFADGSAWFETDRGVSYQVEANVWKYAGGTMVAVVASKPADLGTNDAGFLFLASDTLEMVRWSGSAWVDVGPATLAGTRPAYQVLTTGGTQPGRFSKVSDDNVLGLTLNLSYDGTNFNLDDVTKTGLYLRLYNGQVDIFSATAGANPRTLTTLATVDASGNLNVIGVFKVAGTQVVGARRTGWGTPTATLSRASLTNASGAPAVLQTLSALITDLINTGVIGA